MTGALTKPLLSVIRREVPKPLRKRFKDFIRNVQESVFATSGDGNVRILRQSCTSGYKYETFRICSLNLSNKYFLVSHLKCFHFQGG